MLKPWLGTKAPVVPVAPQQQIASSQFAFVALTSYSLTKTYDTSSGSLFLYECLISLTKSVEFWTLVDVLFCTRVWSFNSIFLNESVWPRSTLCFEISRLAYLTWNCQCLVVSDLFENICNNCCFANFLSLSCHRVTAIPSFEQYLLMPHFAMTLFVIMPFKTRANCLVRWSPCSDLLNSTKINQFRVGMQQTIKYQHPPAIPTVKLSLTHHAASLWAFDCMNLIVWVRGKQFFELICFVRHVLSEHILFSQFWHSFMGHCCCLSAHVCFVGMRSWFDWIEMGLNTSNLRFVMRQTNIDLSIKTWIEHWRNFNNVL